MSKYDAIGYQSTPPSLLMTDEKKCTEINNNQISEKESRLKKGKKSKCVCGKEVKLNKDGIPHGNHLRKSEKCKSHYFKPNNGECYY